MLKRLGEDETHHERIMKSDPNSWFALGSWEFCLFLMQMHLHPPSTLAMTWARPRRMDAASPRLKASSLGFLLHSPNEMLRDSSTTWNRKYVEQLICIFFQTSTGSQHDYFFSLYFNNTRFWAFSASMPSSPATASITNTKMQTRKP